MAAACGRRWWIAMHELTVVGIMVGAVVLFLMWDDARLLQLEGRVAYLENRPRRPPPSIFITVLGGFLIGCSPPPRSGPGSMTVIVVAKEFLPAYSEFLSGVTPPRYVLRICPESRTDCQYPSKLYVDERDWHDATIGSKRQVIR